MQLTICHSDRRFCYVAHSYSSAIWRYVGQLKFCFVLYNSCLFNLQLVNATNIQQLFWILIHYCCKNTVSKHVTFWSLLTLSYWIQHSEHFPKKCLSCIDYVALIPCIVVAVEPTWVEYHLAESKLAWNYLLFHPLSRPFFYRKFSEIICKFFNTNTAVLGSNPASLTVKKSSPQSCLQLKHF
jgi:hypothetical protein